MPVNSIEQSAVRKFAIRLVPFLALMFFINYLDRTAISFAGPNGMNQDLGLSASQFGFASGIFFLENESHPQQHVPNNRKRLEATARWIQQPSTKRRRLSLGPPSEIFQRETLSRLFFVSPPGRLGANGRPVRGWATWAWAVRGACRYMPSRLAPPKVFLEWRAGTTDTCLKFLSRGGIDGNHNDYWIDFEPQRDDGLVSVADQYGVRGYLNDGREKCRRAAGARG